MRCPECKSNIDKGVKFCPKYGKKIKNSKKKIYFSFCIIMVFIFGIIAVKLYISKNENISKSDFNDYIAYDDQFLEIEEKYLNDKGYITKEDIPQLLDDVEIIIKSGENEGVIENYTRDNGNIFIQFSSGINYIFIPLEEDKLSNGEGGQVLTLEPAENSFGVKKERLMTFIDKYYNKLEYTGSFTPVSNANLIKKSFDDIYEYDDITLEIGSVSHKYALKNNEVTIDSLKKWGDSKVIIFEGHGAYNSELHSCLVSGESFFGFEEFSKYNEDIKNKNIVLTSFPEIGETNIAYSPVRKYCITSNFVDNYFETMNDSLIFLGACLSVKDDTLAQALLNKGAAIVMGYNETTSMEYEMMTRSMFFYDLTRMDEQDQYTTVAEALDYAKESIASSDPWGGYNAELVCVSKNNVEGQYTLKGLKDSNTNQEEFSISFANQFYEQLISEEGLADGHIETKIETTEDQGAHTVCLTPESGNLGIIFKDIADFDGNGIDDLIVVTLDGYGGTISLIQYVYFFDAEGNYTETAKSNDIPIKSKCNYYFYKVGNYMVNIFKEDNSGDWIDDLRYEIIENNVQIHDDEIHIMSYDMDAPNNGESIGEVLYIHKDYRNTDSVCYTIDDIDDYYAIYNRGFLLQSADDRCLGSESEGCEFINSLLGEFLGEKAGRIEPTSWDSRWDVNFFPNDSLPERYTILKINATPSYKTGEKTTMSDITIDAEFVNSRLVK